MLARPRGGPAVQRAADEYRSLRIALARCSDGAVLTGVTAARRHGVRRLPADPRLYLLVPNGRQIQGDGVLVTVRTRRLPEPVVRGGLPLAPLPRALADAAAVLDHADAVRA